MSDDTDRRTIALSFEDGPDPVWTRRVLAALEGVEARATFFVTTPRAVVWPEIVARILAGGHEIGLHCGRHLNHLGSTEAAIQVDGEIALKILKSQDVEPALWLPPCGTVAPFSGDVARRLGLRLAAWTIDPGDETGSPQDVIDSVVAQLEPGSIVRVHDGFDESAVDDEACRLSLEMIGPLVERARNLGYETVPVAEIGPRTLNLLEESPAAGHPAAPLPS